MKLTLDEVLKNSAHLFERQSVLLPLWQSIADNFYPERADFTSTRNVGQELADQLIDSFPILARRDMGNSLSAMLRDGDWFKAHTSNEPDEAGREWLDWAGGRMRSVFGRRDSNFVRSTKEGDHDYVTFGQCVISVEPNKRRDGLLYRCWHLRDCAWTEDETGAVANFHRKWSPTVWELGQTFKHDMLHPDCRTRLSKEPYKQVECKHIVMPADMYSDDPEFKNVEFVSLYIDCTHKHLIEEVGLNHMLYVVPRFQTISGSPYAYSPATVVALPEARLMQAMTHTLLEAGERYARPPLIATQQVVRSDVDLSTDGITWVDREYDERMGAALRPMYQDRGGFPIGLELRGDIRDILTSAFYLNKISLPPTDHEMTAYEVQERMKQFRRENLPLFAPIEAEYNGMLCELTFTMMMEMGMLGAPADIPDSISGDSVVFHFNSPLSAAEEEERANRFAQTREILASTIELDPDAIQNVNIDAAMREAILGIGAPQRWLYPREMVAERKVAKKMEQMGEMMLQNPPPEIVEGQAGL